MQYPEQKDWLSCINTSKIDFNAKEISKYIKDGIYKINDQWISEILLKHDYYFLCNVFVHLGFSLSNLDYENTLTVIIWYLYYDVVIDITYENRFAITTANNDEIIKLLGEQWKGTTNRASLIFSAYTGFLAPETIDYTKTERYTRLLQTKNLDLIYKYLYNYENARSPIREMASQKKHILEDIISYDDTELYDWCLQNEIVPFKFINFHKPVINLPQIYENLDIKEWYEFKTTVYLELKQYANLGKEGFEGLTDLQLIHIYKPPNLGSRRALIGLIRDKVKHWRSYHSFYGEFKVGTHIIDLETRSNTIGNEIIAFGELDKYNFWNLDELIESFKSNINFKYPDNISIFTLSEIHELQNFLRSVKIGESLIMLIEEKLKTFTKIKDKLQLLKEVYGNCSHKIILTRILLQLFYLGLYSRFWKGRDYDYPYDWKDLDQNTEDHQFREDKVNEIIAELLSVENSYAIYFFELIFRIQIDWSDISKVEYGEENILSICKAVYAGEFCLSHFSNIALQSSYYIIVVVLGLDLGVLLKEDGCKPTFMSEKMIDSYHRDPTLKLIKVEV